DIERALGFAEIDARSLADVRYRWGGSITLLVDRVRPVLALLQVPTGGLESAPQDEEELAAWLSGRVVQWHAAEMLRGARRSLDDEAMGRRAREALGDVAELPRWNAALGSLGSRYGPVRNKEASEQAKARLAEMLPDLQALTRWIAKTEGRPARFLELE